MGFGVWPDLGLCLKSILCELCELRQTCSLTSLSFSLLNSETVEILSNP